MQGFPRAFLGFSIPSIILSLLLPSTPSVIAPPSPPTPFCFCHSKGRRLLDFMGSRENQERPLFRDITPSRSPLCPHVPQGAGHMEGSQGVL